MYSLHVNVHNCFLLLNKTGMSQQVLVKLHNMQFHEYLFSSRIDTSGQKINMSKIKRHIFAVIHSKSNKN
jgi:hypothetical protein